MGHFRKKVKSITNHLHNESIISATKHATVANIRSYLRKNTGISAAKKKEITEENCVEAWVKHCGELSESDSESEDELF